jgi:hypothetical protein
MNSAHDEDMRAYESTGASGQLVRKVIGKRAKEGGGGNISRESLGVDIILCNEPRGLRRALLEVVVGDFYIGLIGIGNDVFLQSM